MRIKKWGSAIPAKYISARSMKKWSAVMRTSKSKQLAFILWVLLPSAVEANNFFSWLFTPNDEITSEIHIINKCQLDTKYFIVRDLKTGNYASFNSDVAKLKTKMNSPLQLQLSPAVKYIYFEGNAVAAKQSLTMIADCTERNIEAIKR